MVWPGVSTLVGASFPVVSAPEYSYFTALRQDYSAKPFHHRRFFFAACHAAVPPPRGERELIASGLSRRLISNRLLASPAPAMTPGASHLRRQHDKMWVALSPQFEVRRLCVFENPHLVISSLLIRRARRTRQNRGRGRTRDNRSRGRTRNHRSRSRTRNHRSRSRTRNHRSRSRTRNHRGRSRTRNHRGRSRATHRSRAGHRARSLAAWAKSVEPRAKEISPVSSFHVGIESSEPNDYRRQRE